MSHQKKVGDVRKNISDASDTFNPRAFYTRRRDSSSALLHPEQVAAFEDKGRPWAEVKREYNLAM